MIKEQLSFRVEKCFPFDDDDKVETRKILLPVRRSDSGENPINISIISEIPPLAKTSAQDLWHTKYTHTVTVTQKDWELRKR